MKGRLPRIEQTEQGAIGVLLMDDSVFCFTLQPDITDKHFHLPAGEFICRRFHGTKYPNTFEIVRPGTDGVDGHKYLLFHAGNDEDDTEGCTILGETTGKLAGKRAVLNSGNTFKRFLEYTKDVDEFSLTVQDCY